MATVTAHASLDHKLSFPESGCAYRDWQGMFSKTGRKTTWKLERLHKGLLEHLQRGNLLRFLENPSIPLTNNAAERALRSGVIARKVSQCSKTQRGADGYAMIKSVVETARRQGQHPLNVLVGLQARAAPR